MVEIHKRLKVIHAVFCKERCKYHQGGQCIDVHKEATLSNCPVGEWWDLNDWLIGVEIIVGKIQRQYTKGQVQRKEDSGGILREQ